MMNIVDDEDEKDTETVSSFESQTNLIEIDDMDLENEVDTKKATKGHATKSASSSRHSL